MNYRKNLAEFLGFLEIDFCDWARKNLSGYFREKT